MHERYECRAAIMRKMSCPFARSIYPYDPPLATSIFIFVIWIIVTITEETFTERALLHARSVGQFSFVTDVFMETAISIIDPSRDHFRSPLRH